MIYKVYRNKFPNEKITLKQVASFLNNQETYTLHRNARRHYPRNPVFVGTMNFQYGTDLIDMIAYKDDNLGYKFIFIMIDCFTKYAYAEPMMSKSARDTLSAFQKILGYMDHTPVVLTSDNGTEYKNRFFQQFLKSKKNKKQTFFLLMISCQFIHNKHTLDFFFHNAC